MGEYTSIHMVSFGITKAITTGQAALLQGHDVTCQATGASMFTITLERVDGGWRAVDIASGLHG